MSLYSSRSDNKKIVAHKERHILYPWDKKNYQRSATSLILTLSSDLSHTFWPMS